MAHGKDEPGDPRHRGPDRARRTASTTTATRTCGPTTSSPIRPSTCRTGAAIRLREDRRWEYGVPPVGNANFAWMQHFLYHLAPRGIAGFVLANGSMSSNQSGEGNIRRSIIEAGLVDCIIALPGQLFRSTQIPACLWFLRRGRGGRERSGETLFIDARKMGHMLDRTRRDLSDARNRPHRGHLPRVARPRPSFRRSACPESLEGPESRGERGGGQCLHRRPRLLQECHYRRNPQARPRPHTQAATSVPSRSPTTACRSPTRWPASPPSGGSNRPRRGGWTRRSRRTSRVWGSGAEAREKLSRQLRERKEWQLTTSNLRSSPEATWRHPARANLPYICREVKLVPQYVQLKGHPPAEGAAGSSTVRATGCYWTQLWRRASSCGAKRRITSDWEETYRAIADVPNRSPRANLSTLPTRTDVAWQRWRLSSGDSTYRSRTSDPTDGSDYQHGEGRSSRRVVTSHAPVHWRRHRSSA